MNARNWFELFDLLLINVIMIIDIQKLINNIKYVIKNVY